MPLGNPDYCTSALILYLKSLIHYFHRNPPLSLAFYVFYYQIVFSHFCYYISHYDLYLVLYHAQLFQAVHRNCYFALLLSLLSGYSIVLWLHFFTLVRSLAVIIRSHIGSTSAFLTLLVISIIHLTLSTLASSIWLEHI